MNRIVSVPPMSNHHRTLACDMALCIPNGTPDAP
jgi:hypothetical protein